MIYILTTACILIGIGYHVMQIVKGLRKRYPDFGISEVFKTFFREEWDSLIMSGMGLFAFELWIFISRVTGIELPDWYFDWGVYAIAAVWGYAGQRLAYKYLGTAEEVLSKKAKLNNND